MPRYWEYWHCVDNGLCTQCWEPSHFTKCDRCQEKEVSRRVRKRGGKGRGEGALATRVGPSSIRMTTGRAQGRSRKYDAYRNAMSRSSRPPGGGRRQSKGRGEGALIEKVGPSSIRSTTGKRAQANRALAERHRSRARKMGVKRERRQSGLCVECGTAMTSGRQGMRMRCDPCLKKWWKRNAKQ